MGLDQVCMYTAPCTSVSVDVGLNAPEAHVPLSCSIMIEGNCGPQPILKKET